MVKVYVLSGASVQSSSHWCYIARIASEILSSVPQIKFFMITTSVTRAVIMRFFSVEGVGNYIAL